MDDNSIWIFAGAIAVAATAFLWLGATSIMAMASPLRRRLKSLRATGDVLAGHGSATRGQAGQVWRLLEPGKESERAEVQLRLVRAGFRMPGAMGLLYGVKLVCALLTPVAVLVGLSAGEVHLPFFGLVGAGLAAAFFGSLLPDMYLSRRFASRKERLMEGLPDALDLLVTCTEAGLGLNAALERVVEQMPASHPELAIELGQVNAEIRAGVERNLALRNLGERTGLEEINGLVSLISHSTRLGTGIASTLRIYSEDFRDRRMQRAEEAAATVGTKLIFPLLLCLFPSFFVVAVGPAILSALDNLSGS